MRISDWSSDVCSSDLPSRRSVHAVDNVNAELPGPESMRQRLLIGVAVVPVERIVHGRELQHHHGFGALAAFQNLELAGLRCENLQFVVRRMLGKLRVLRYSGRIGRLMTDDKYIGLHGRTSNVDRKSDV